MLKTAAYNMRYSTIPPSLFNQPNIATLIAACIKLASQRTKKITAIITIKKDRIGSHCLPVLNECCSQFATIYDSFMAAAMPIIIARKENTATIKPRLIPFITARTSSIKKIMSIIIGKNLVLFKTKQNQVSYILSFICSTIPSPQMK